ncbi:hypothetical protein Tco_0968922 [Tanacetum coccineum]
MYLNLFHTQSLKQRLSKLGEKVEAMPKSAWTEKDQINNFLKERRLMRSLEGDLRLRQKNHMILSYDVLINQVDPHGFEDGGGVKEIQRSFRHSDTERLSRSDEVLKLKNFKKDATLKLSKSSNQERVNLSESWTHFKNLLQKVPYHGIDLWLQVQIVYDRIDQSLKRTVDYTAKGRLRKMSAEKAWATIEGLA